MISIGQQQPPQRQAAQPSWIRRVLRVLLWCVVMLLVGAGVFLVAPNVWVALIALLVAMAGFAGVGGCLIELAEGPPSSARDAREAARAAREERFQAPGWRVLYAIVGLALLLSGIGLIGHPSVLIALWGVVVIVGAFFGNLLAGPW